MQCHLELLLLPDPCVQERSGLALSAHGMCA